MNIRFYFLGRLVEVKDVRVPGYVRPVDFSSINVLEGHPLDKTMLASIGPESKDMSVWQQELQAEPEAPSCPTWKWCRYTLFRSLVKTITDVTKTSS